MNNSLMKSSLLALSLVMAATVANSATNQVQAHHGQHKGQPPSATELVARMDTNQDNKLSKSEVKGPLSQHFDEVDSNGDGYITEAELKANKPKGKVKHGEHKKKKPPSATAIISKLDANNDQKLDKTEVKGPLSQHFNEVDSNGDGYITKAELKANKPKGKMKHGEHKKRKPPSATAIISKLDANNDQKLDKTEVKGPSKPTLY